VDLEQRLSNIEALVAALIEREVAKEWYTTEEFAKLVRKAEFTVREWCRHGRVRWEKKGSGRGK
jgi:CRISPR/Cas system Type II protein with McrA/HNH and RuvC-like nuclease domain